MKLAHACILVTLTVPIAFLTTRKKVTTRKRYDSLLTLTMLLELSYIMPLAFAVKRSLDEKSYVHADLFSDWLAALTRDTNVNVFGAAWMGAITLGVYAVTIMMQCLTCALTSSIKELETLRDKVHFDLILD